MQYFFFLSSDGFVPSHLTIDFLPNIKTDTKTPDELGLCLCVCQGHIVELIPDVSHVHRNLELFLLKIWHIKL